MKLKPIFLFLLYFVSTHICVLHTSAQTVENILLNAYQTGNVIQLNFATEPPSVSMTSIPGSYEGIAHYEKNGEILFTAQTGGIFNAENNFMEGATGIFFDDSSAEMCISPDPADPNRYYVIYNNEKCSNLYYSVVDMTLNGGLGDVVNLNTLISEENFSEGLEVVAQPLSNDFWLLTYKCGIGFTRFTINENGINEEQLLYSFDPGISYDGRGELDYHKGRMGAAFAYSNKVFAAGFNPITGEICDATVIEDDNFSSSFTGSYGIEFSPSGNKMYFSIWYNTGNNQIYQYDFNTQTYTGYSLVMDTPFNGFGEMELAPNGKIYVMMDNYNKLMVIENPDEAIPIFNTIVLPGTTALGMSDPIQSYVYNDLIYQTDSLCSIPNMPLQLNAHSNYDSYNWATSDDPETTIGTEATLNIDFSDTTQVYYLEGTNGNACFSAFEHFTVFPIPEIDAGPDLTITSGESIQLQSINNTQGAQVIWFPSTGLDDPFANQPIASPTETTTYLMSAYVGPCQEVDEVTITVDPMVSVAPVPVPQACLVLPSAFSPNNDGINDLFRIPPTSNVIDVKAFQVFNRWGVMVWEGATLTDTWNGTYQGEHANNGTYFYYLEAICGQTGATVQAKGYVTLVR